MAAYSTSSESTIIPIEASVLTPVFIDGIAGMEVDRHGIVRLALFTEQRAAGSSDMDHVVSVRLLIPREVLVNIAERSLVAATEGRLVRPSTEMQRGLN